MSNPHPKDVFKHTFKYGADKLDAAQKRVLQNLKRKGYVDSGGEPTAQGGGRRGRSWGE